MRELVVELAGRHALGRLRDALGLLGLEKPKLGVHAR